MLRPMTVRPRSLLIVLAATVALGGCDSGSGGAASAACASSIKYGGQDYFGHAAKFTPSDLGAELGEARIPACNDTGGSSARDEEVVAVDIKGVSPSVAVASYSDSLIFMRKDQSFGAAPQEVLRLLRAVDGTPPPVAAPARSASVCDGASEMATCVEVRDRRRVEDLQTAFLSGKRGGEECPGLDQQVYRLVFDVDGGERRVDVPAACGPTLTPPSYEVTERERELVRDILDRR